MSVVETETGGGVGMYTPGQPMSDMVRIDQLVGYEGGDPPSADFIKSVGQKLYYPILVRPVAGGGPTDDRLEVLDGRRRLQAAIALGWTHIPATIEDAEDDTDSRVAALVTNFLRSDNLLGSAKAVWSLMDEGVAAGKAADETLREFSRAQLIDIARLRALRDMRKLVPELIEAVENGQMKSWAARMAARQPESVQLGLVEEKLKVNGKVTAKDVENSRKVKVKAAVALVNDLFENLPELDDVPEYGPAPDPTLEGTIDEYLNPDAHYEIEPTAPVVATKPKKVTPDERRAQALELVYQALQELEAITKSKQRNADKQAIFLLNDIQTTLTGE